MFSKLHRGSKDATAVSAVDCVLGRFTPVLQYDSQASYRSVAVETMTDNPGNVLVRGKDSIASVTGIRGLDVSVLGDSNRARRSKEAIKQAADHLHDAGRFQEAGRYADRVYGRVRKVGERTYLQYHLWFYYAPLELRGGPVGHGGAWRAVHVELDAKGVPVRVLLEGTLVRTRAWDDVEMTDGHPVIYVTPCDHDLRFAHDDLGSLIARSESCDGKGRAVHPVIEPFGGWVTWPGRWGTGGTSPRSPANRASWKNPRQLLLSEKVSAALEAYMRFIGRQKGTETDPPVVEGRLEHGRVVVRYQLKKRGSSDGLMATVHDGDTVVGAARIERPQRDGEGWVTVPTTLTQGTLRVSAGAMGGRSAVVSCMLAASEPDVMEQTIFQAVAEAELGRAETQRFAQLLSISRSQLMGWLGDKKVQQDIWTTVAGELQAFREARTNDARRRQATDERRRATRSALLASLGILAQLVLAAVLVVVGLEEALWVFLALWWLPFLAIVSAVTNWQVRRKAQEAVEIASAAIGDDPDGSVARGRFEAALRERGIAPAVRERLNFATEDSYGEPLLVGAEGLRELRVADQEVDTVASKTLQALMSRMRDGSIGIAGPRGAGKTTLINAFCKRRSAHDRRLTAVVSAPVRYEVRDFVLALFTQLCENALREQRNAPDIARLGRATRRRYRLLAVALVIASVLGAVAASDLLGDTLRLILGGAGLALSLLAVWFTLTRRERLSGPTDTAEGHLAHHAAEELHDARFQQSFSQGYSGKLRLPIGAEIGIDQREDLAKRQRSLPEIVTALREFLAEAARVRGGCVIGIDEMDKMESAEAAQQFLNEIKGIFGVKDCFFLVSISEGAMSSFERRGLPFRDVFDSSFDEVLHVSTLPLAQSNAVLRRRVIGLSPPFLDVCHCLSGGLARDLLRVVRKLSLLKLSGPADRALANVCGELVKAELTTKVEASMIAAQGGSVEPDVSDVLGWMRGLADSKISWRALEQSALSVPPQRSVPAESEEEETELERLRIEVGGFVYFLATVLRFFTATPPDVESYFVKAETVPDGGISQIDLLAGARAHFEINARLAISLVDEFRAQRNWPKLGSCVVGGSGGETIDAQPELGVAEN